MTTRLRVIKLGGSLLDWPELPIRLGQWLSAQPPAASVLIVGGGPLVDALRGLDRRLELSPQAAHWAAVRLMDLMAELVTTRLPGARLLGDWRSIDRRSTGGLQVVRAEPFLRADAANSDALPIGWHVTSDSIAVRLARVLEADELVLLKSTGANVGSTAQNWADAGLVDNYFPTAAATFRAQIVNLRESVMCHPGPAATGD